MATTPVGKAQSIVLKALNLTAPDFQSAEKVFESLGLVVIPVRVGKSSFPKITIKSRTNGIINREGEGEGWRQYEDLTPEQLIAIAQWVAK